MSQTPVKAFGELTYQVLTLLALGGAAAGWLITDGLARLGRSRWVPAAATVLLAVVTYRILTTAGGRLDVVLLGATAGAMVRGTRRRSVDPSVLVALAAVSTWVAYDVATVLHRPMRDLHTYLAAAGNELAGGHAYLQAPLTSLPDGDRFPFVYPPFTLPLFEALSRLPLRAVELGWLGLSTAAVVSGLWLIGVRGRWLLGFLAWPAFAVGLSVGNVAPFGFLCLALGYRYGGALVLGGLFKLQAGIPALWTLRERRPRDFVVGLGFLLLLVLLTLPLTGWAAWVDWVRALGYFEQGLDRFAMRGASLTRYLPAAAVVVIAAVAILVALLGRGRNGLGRFGLASIVGSPTLYIHGFGLLLPGALALPPQIFWFVSAIVAWDAWGYPVSAGWIALVIVAAALVRSREPVLAAPSDLPEAAADLHPAGAGGLIWPDRDPTPETEQQRENTPRRGGPIGRARPQKVGQFESGRR